MVEIPESSLSATRTYSFDPGSCQIITDGGGGGS